MEKSPDQIAEIAAQRVLSDHAENIEEVYEGEHPLIALGYAMGEDIGYVEAMRQLVAHAIEIDRGQRGE